MENTTAQTYPVVLYPTEGSLFIPPTDPRQNCKHKTHGQSELVAFARFFKYGCSEIREDVCVKICGHTYEPDFAYINIEKGVCIDIEVDEPYAASGHATHFLTEDGQNKDFARNKRFQDAGWYVIRFSEEQMFCHTRECLREVYKLALVAGAIDRLPEVMLNVFDLQSCSRWTRKDSNRMNHNRYRKTYLGYDPSHMGVNGYVRCTKLILPVMLQSLGSGRVCREMLRQLNRFFFKSVISVCG